MEHKEKTTEEKIAVMQHYLNGGKIEYANKGENDWEENDSPTWNWEIMDYRIVKKPKYVPYTYEDREMFRDKWIKSKRTDNESKIIFIEKDEIRFINKYGMCEDCNYCRLLEDFMFLDGTPCGKLEE